MRRRSPLVTAAVVVGAHNAGRRAGAREERRRSEPPPVKAAPAPAPAPTPAPEQTTRTCKTCLAVQSKKYKFCHDCGAGMGHLRQGVPCPGCKHINIETKGKFCSMCSLSLICACGIRKSGAFCAGCAQPSIPPMVQANPPMAYQPFPQTQVNPPVAYPQTQPAQYQVPPPSAGYPPGYSIHGQPVAPAPNPFAQQPNPYAPPAGQ